MFEELFEHGRRGSILSLEEQPRGGVAMPAVWMVQKRDQFFRRGGAEMRQPRLLERFRDDAVNAAAVIPAAQVEMSFNGFRKRPRVLDDFAVHVGDVERAVWRVRQLHRTKPIVSAG